MKKQKPLKKPKKESKGWFRKLLGRRIFIVLLLLLQLGTIIYLILDDSITSEVFRKILGVISVLVALHIIYRHDKEAYKLTWVFVILIFPVFGGLFYLLFRYQTRSKKLLRVMKTIDDGMNTAHALDSSVLQKAVDMAPKRQKQFEYIEKYSHFPLYENTVTKHYSPGELFFEDMLVDLKKAENYIFIESYIIKNGVMWQSIYEILKEKAANGVDVRVVYDDFGCLLRVPLNFAKMLESDGIKCCTFNKFHPLLSTIQNNRDHRKIVAIDGKIAYNGGINIADEYINKKQLYGHWKDTGVRIEGQAAWSFVLIFLQMWQLVGNKEEDLSRYYPWKDSPCPIHKEDSFVAPFSDSPFDDEHVMEHVYTQMINRADKYLYVMTPYLIPDNSMISALTLAAKSGVDVRIITPYHWDKRVVHFTTRSYYQELLSAGVRIYEYTPGFIHSKTLVSDDDIACIGTANMDLRSLFLQFECSTFMYKSEAVTALRDDFLKTLEISHEVTLDEVKCGHIKLFMQQICRLFAPLM